MGYTYRNNGRIKDFWPDNDEDTLYIHGDFSMYSLQDLLDMAWDHFGSRFDRDKIQVSAEYIHTSCLTYDQYDPSDYSTFIVLTLGE